MRPIAGRRRGGSVRRLLSEISDPAEQREMDLKRVINL